MILDNIKNIYSSLLINLNKSKNELKVILDDIPKLDIFINNSININNMHLKQVEYYNYHKKIIEFIGNISNCNDLDTSDLKFMSIIDEFYNLLINYMDVNNANYNQMEILIDNTATILLKNVNPNKKNKILIDNLIQIKNNKLNYNYLKYYNSVYDSYSQIISFIENKLIDVFKFKNNNNNINNLNYI